MRRLAGRDNREAAVRLVILVAALLAVFSTGAGAQRSTYYGLQKGDFPHDVAASPIGEVWYAGQRAGVAGRLDLQKFGFDRTLLVVGIIASCEGSEPKASGPYNRRRERRKDPP